MLLGQVLKGVDLVHSFLEDLVEEVVDSGTALALGGNVLHEVTVQTILVFLEEFVDKHKDGRPHLFRIHVRELSIECE